MQVPGPCSICGRVDILKTCAQCGRAVCREHHEAGPNACTICARRGRPTPTPSGGPPPAAPPGDLPEVPEDAGGRYT